MGEQSATEQGIQEIRPTYKKEYSPNKIETQKVKNLHGFLKKTDKYLHRVEKDYKRKPEIQDLVLKLTNIDGQLKSLKPKDLQSEKDETNEDQSEKIKDLQLKKVVLSSKIRNYFLENYCYYFRLLEDYEFGDVNSKLEEQPDLKEKAREIIINETLSFLHKRQGLPGINDPTNIAISTIGNHMVKNSKDFQSLGSQIDLTQQERPLEAVKKLEMSMQVGNEALLADENIRKLAMRQWIQYAITETEKGNRVIFTPYYQSLFEQIQRIGDRENGIGGKLYYGPPGTGKTELAVQANRIEGFDTRVVSMHYWTDFSTLLGEAPVPVGLDRATGMMQRLKIAHDHFSKMSSEEFRTTIQTIHRQKIQRNKLLEKSSPLETISPFLVNVKENILNSPIDQISTESWGEIQQGLIRYFDKQLLAVAVGELTGEDEIAQWVKGEILIAAENGQRLLLDEIDKAGPNSVSGISRLLAMSSDQPIDLKGERFYLPSWFKIDATSNDMLLLGDNRKKENFTPLAIDSSKSYLYDRFNHVFMGYPPIKDELMLATVWASDSSGNILLTAEEQNQIITVFEHIIKDVQNLYQTGELSQPLTLRGLKEMMSYLVDPLTKRRTGTPVLRALEMVLLEQRSYGALSISKEDAHSFFRTLINKDIDQLQTAQSSIDTFGDLTPIEKSLKQRRLNLVKEALERIQNDPLMNYVINDQKDGVALDEAIKNGEQVLLPDKIAYKVKIPETSSPTVLKMVETAENEVALKKEKLAEIANLAKKSEYSVQIGPETHLDIFKRDGNMIIETHSIVGDKDKIIGDIKISDEKTKIMDYSSDGKRLLLASDHSNRFTVHNMERNQDELEVSVADMGEITKYFDISLDQLETTIVWFDRQNSNLDKKGNLFLFTKINEKNVKLSFDQPVRRYNFSKDGRFIILEDVHGRTHLIDYLRTKQRVSGKDNFKLQSIVTPINLTDLLFVTQNLMIRKQDNQAIILN